MNTLSDLPLFECRAATRPQLTGDAELDADFWAFRDENPDVERRLVELIREYLHCGHLHFRMFWELVRAERLKRTKDAHGFVLNNDLQQPWVLYLMRTYPEFAGRFEVRRRRKDGDA